MAIPTYEIYALKYGGPYTRPGCIRSTGSRIWIRTTQIQLLHLCHSGRRGNDCRGLRVHPDAAKQRNLASYVSPAELLKRIDIDAAKVKHLILTHVHFDHVSGIQLFPKAAFTFRRKSSTSG